MATGYVFHECLVLSSDPFKLIEFNKTCCLCSDAELPAEAELKAAIQSEIEDTKKERDHWRDQYANKSDDDFLRSQYAAKAGQLTAKEGQLTAKEGQLTELLKKDNSLRDSAAKLAAGRVDGGDAAGEPAPKRARAEGDCWGGKGVFSFDGIDLSSFHLPRTDLVERTIHLIQENRFVLLTSPAGTGKTSLLMLLAKKLPSTIYIGCSSSSKWCDILKSNGIDLDRQTVSLQDEEILFMLDDAQNSYSMELVWEALIKTLAPKYPPNVRFIISATHSIEMHRESPVVFQRDLVCRLERKDFLLSDEESDLLLLKSPYGLPCYVHEFETLLQQMRYDCAGHAAALVGAARVISGVLRHQIVDEQKFLTVYYSNVVTESLYRCFGSQHLDPLQCCLDLLQKCLFQNSNLVLQTLPEQDQKACLHLVKRGILVGTSALHFSSPMARRYFASWIFPHKATKDPSSLNALILAAIRSLSANDLKKSTTCLEEFPNETTFQHFIMRSLCANTSPDCCICPELSRVYENPAERIRGRIDFYLDGTLQWGVELLVEGRAIKEHHARFGPDGKYFALGLRDFVVVDLRPMKSDGSSIKCRPKGLTVLFESDFSACKCLYENGEEVDVRLSP